jgi:hypothetical protein
LTSQKRLLTQEEIDDAKRVYQKTIKYGFVYIADDLGAGGREYTEPSGGKMDLYVIHLGSLGFASTIGPDIRATLIHELCHVWQGMHHVFSWSYVLGSLANQALSGSAAYDYTPGQHWGEYNVEQQASIVEDWYRDGLRTTSPLYRYIVGNIRCPIRSWFGETLIEIGSGAAAVKG